MEKRNSERKPSSLPVEVTVGPRSWFGSCINISEEGALLKLETLWEGDPELSLWWDRQPGSDGTSTRAKVVRSSSPDLKGSFLAVRFLSENLS